VKLLDANVLLHASNAGFPDHSKARKWLEAALSGTEPVGIAWITIVAFLRIATNPRGFLRPLSAREATTAVQEWLDRENVRVLEGGESHWPLLRSLIEETTATGNLVNDAHLAALAKEHGATIWTNDRDFARFEVEFRDPLGE
jgi:toxin-antitoxin system PIN domain toxin